MSTLSPPSPRPAPPRAALGGAFLAGAGGRLLPASVPLRYFGAAALFHLAAWLVVLLAAPAWSGWRGGPGWPLAALHLVTLGTLATSAVGASLQLLPVATRQPVRWPRLPALLWWLHVPGVAVLATGMGLGRPPLVAAGAAAVTAALLPWGLLLALNLRAAAGMAGVVLHGWGAVAALALLLGSAAALVALWLGRPLIDRDAARGLHLAAGVLGLMGLLALGLSYVLVPLFALGRVPADGRQRQAGAAALAATACAVAAPLLPALTPPLRAAALALAAVALLLHLRLMREVLADAMRPELGLSGRLMRAGWAGAALALVTGALAVAPGSHPVWTLLFGLAAVGGWLLSFLFGVLQRIVPFLASMHAAQGRRRPPTPTALTHATSLRWHAVAHALALLLLAAGLALSSPLLVRAAGAAGSVGAGAFVVFLVVVWRRLGRTRADPTPA